MSTIRETVQASIGTIPSEYEYMVERVISALEERESAHIDALRGYAYGQGLDTQQQDTLLRNAGLSEYTPTFTEEERFTRDEAPSPTDGGLADVARRIEERYLDLSAKVDALTRAAARHGVSV